jgi:hypothetical protein
MAHSLAANLLIPPSINVADYSHEIAHMGRIGC